MMLYTPIDTCSVLILWCSSVRTFPSVLIIPTLVQVAQKGNAEELLALYAKGDRLRQLLLKQKTRKRRKGEPETEEGEQAEGLDLLEGGSEGHGHVKGHVCRGDAYSDGDDEVTSFCTILQTTEEPKCFLFRGAPLPV